MKPKKYYPSNSTEGFWFEDRFCDKCVKETWNPETDYGDKCDILNRALLFGVDDKQYPVEWKYDESTGLPKCIEFSTEKKKESSISPGQITF